MNRFLSKLIALVALSYGSALAQTQVFYADDLARAPSGIAVSPGYLTILEFYQEVDQVASGRPGMMKVEVNGAKIYVSALVQSGSTDLVVEVGSRTQLFRVSVMKGNAPRRYVIVLQKPAPRVTAPAPQTVTPPPAAPAAKPPTAPRPVVSKPAAPRPAATPQSTSTVAAGSVVGLNDPSARLTVPMTVPSQPAVSRPAAATSPVKPAVAARMVYADFERQQGLKPIGNLGGSTIISSFEQNPTARTVLPEGISGGPALLLDAEGALSQRAFLNYQTFAPNDWAGASLDINALPAKNGRKQALDVSAYDTVTMELSATGARTLQIEFRSMENGLVSAYGEYPQAELTVGATPQKYRIALATLRPPSWAKSPLNIKDVLRRLTEISIKVVTKLPAQGRVTVDNIVFERSGSVAANANPVASPVNASKPISPAKPTVLSSAQPPTLNPASLEFGVLRQVAGSRAGDLAIYYAIKNIGARAVTISVKGLRVKQAGRDLTTSLRVDLVSISLRPGQAHLGTIIVRDAKPGNLVLSWTAAELGTGRSYVLERNLQIQVIPINNRP